jgi:hypothetical protein
MPGDVIERVKAMGSINLNDTCGNEDDLDSIHDSINSSEELLRTKNEAEAGEDNMINPQQDPANDIIEDLSCLEEPEGEYIQDTDVLEENTISTVEELENNSELIDGAENVGNLIDNNQNIEQPVESNLEGEMELRYGVRSGRYDLRPRRPRDYSHLHATMDHTCITQYNLKRGLQIFGNDGIKAVQEELKQLHDRNVLTPFDGRTLGTQERQAALPYLMFLKQK